MGGDDALAVRGRHLPALDGLRALAVAGVVAYHLRLGWAGGGYLGVDLFFVLSGFLITGLLVEEHLVTGRIALGAFWARRARRLLPALLLLLAALAVAAALGAATHAVDLRALRDDALATIAYVANWHQLVAGQSYFAQFQAPSPLQHTWSLGIEEQFYVLWPLLLVVVLRSGRAPGGGTWSGRRAVIAGTLGAAVASAALMGWLAASGAGLDRLYYGTDTRAFDLLAGAALALAVAARPEPGRPARRLLHVAGPVAALVLLALWATAGAGQRPPRLMFEGGFLLAAVAAVVVLADARLAEPGPLGRVLRLAPLRLLGRISYGVYLWHWPVIVEVTPARTGLTGAGLDLVQVAVTLALAGTSYVLVEQPLRRARLVRWPLAARLALVPTAMAVTAGLVAVSTLPPAVAQAAAGDPGPAGVVPGAGGVRPGQPVSLPAGRVPSTAAPLRVLLVGDSVMRTESPALRAALAATGAAVVDDVSYPGWGLSTDHTWSTDVPGLLERTRPDLVVAMWSWDDTWLLSDPAGYRRTLERYVDLLLHPGGGAPGVAGVVFEQFPPLGPAASAGDPSVEAQRVAGVAAWNAMVSSLPAAFPGHVAYLPLAGAVELDGRYASWLPPPGSPAAPVATWDRVRAIDDTHFCPAGAGRYASALVADLGQLLSLPPAAPSWWTGSWAQDAAAYDTPQGTCPADHPSSAAAATR